MGNKIGFFDPGVAARSAAVPSEGRITDFRLPSVTAGPGNDLIDDGQGRLWFNEIYGNKIGSFDTRQRSFREFPLPSEASMPVGLARDARGIFWAAQFRTNSLARLDPRDGSVAEYRLPTDGAMPAGVAIDEKGAPWITELGANRLATFDAASGRFVEYELPRKDSSPLHVASDGHGSIWYTASEESGNYLGRFDLRTHDFEIHELPTPRCSPIGLLIDGGSIWVTEGGAAKLARFDVARGAWEEYPIPAAKSEPAKISKDRRGRIWITDGGGMGGTGGNQLVVFDPLHRSFDFISMRTGGAKPRGILGTDDGSVWFTQQNANTLSHITWEAR
jgi:virginiamycin B lyase